MKGCVTQQNISPNLHEFMKPTLHENNYRMEEYVCKRGNKKSVNE